MNFEANCQTTAMGIMPHRNPDRALDLALNLDIPFWPQLPRASFTEDMFAQLSDGFPGAAIDYEEKRVMFDTQDFHDQIAEYSALMESNEIFTRERDTSMTFPRFIISELFSKSAIRGQVCGPVNFGFRVVDEEKRPLIYNEEVRGILFDFVKRKVNAHYQLLSEIHPNAFVWVDEPGLGWVFNSFAGYNELQAQDDYRNFLAGFEGPRALHLCLNVHLPYLFDLGLDLLSVDVFQLEVMPRSYAQPIADFLNSGGIFAWGIVPTESETLNPETPQSLFERLTGYWQIIAENANISAEQIAQRALIAPSKCCIKNAVRASISNDEVQPAADCSNPQTEESLVERAFAYLPQISEMLRKRYRLD